MLTGRCESWLAAGVLLGAFCTAAGGAEPVSYEAEDLASRADITGGGDLLVIPSSESGRITFSGGKAVSFVPRGKGSSIDFILPVPAEGIYQLVIRGVVGPSCGIYQVLLGEDVRAWINFSSEKTAHTDQTPNLANGAWTKRMALRQGPNRIRFEYQDAQRRGGALVIDSLRLQPYRRSAVNVKDDPYESELPPGEKRGPNLVKNDGFEDFGAADRFERQHQPIAHWQFNSPVPRRTPCIVREAAKAHRGRCALLLSPDLLDDNAVVYQAYLPMESGQQYRVSVFVRGEGRFSVDFYQPRPAKAEDSQRVHNQFTAGKDWRRYSFVVIPSRSAKITQVALALIAWEGSAICFDDVSVQALE